MAITSINNTEYDKGSFINYGNIPVFAILLVKALMSQNLFTHTYDRNKIRK